MRTSKNKLQNQTRVRAAGRMLLLALVANLATWAKANEPVKPAGANAVDATRELIVDAAAEPVPAFRYHLLPPPAQQIRGNAAPILTRILHQKSDEWKKRLYDDVSDLNDMPFEQLDLDKARETLEFLADTIKQLRAAALRSGCDWEYVTEDQDPLQILLSDAQSMRGYLRLLMLKSRYEMRMGNLPEALAAIEASTALARHTAAAPFLVNQLIGGAILEAGVFEQLDTFVSQPGAPNLYWALASLPRPLNSMATGLETERQIIVIKFPELADMNQPHPTQEWQRLAFELRKWSAEVRKSETGLGGTVDEIIQAIKPATPDQLAMARVYLRDVGPLPSDQVAAMSDAEVEVRYTVALWAEVCDAWRKWFFVPYPHGLAPLDERNKALVGDARRRELFPLLSALSPLGGSLLVAQARPQVRLARLQTIEAVRMHAATTGKLPASLAEITVVPVPNDPATGAPFRYTLDGDVAMLDLAEEVVISREHVQLPVRIRLREQK